MPASMRASWVATSVWSNAVRNIWRARRTRRLVLGGLVLLAGLAFWSALPNPLFDSPYSPVLFSRHGKLLEARIAADQQWRFPESRQVPKKYVAALIEYEDKRFYWHPGVDPIAVARALYLNIRHHSVVSGASTITMQVIRLARGPRARTYGEKLIEMVLALRLELGYSKREILRLYASHAPFGGNVVGIEAASWRYFGRPPEDLSWAESCLLAVLPNSPALIHPGRNRDRLKAKRDRLLRALNKDGRLGATDLKLALLEPLPRAPLPFPHYAPHLLDTLYARAGGHTYRFDSTIDRGLQRSVNRIVHEHMTGLRSEGIDNAAVVVVDNRTMETLAYVGNSDGIRQDDSGSAVDIIQCPRSTGSILKPFLFAAKLQAGEILPDTLVPDIPTQYNGYMPQNYDRRYRGAVPAKVALAHSLNVPAVRMLQEYGVARFYDFLQQAGMTTLFRPPGGYGLALILGGAEGSLWDLTGMYARLAAVARGDSRDLAMRPVRLLIHEPSNGDEHLDINPGAAYLTLKALLEVNRPLQESHWKNFSSSRKVAWKTGTSFGERDAWAIGDSSRYTVGVWVGNASGEGRPELIGVAVAAPIMFDVFGSLDRSAWFTPPGAWLKQVLVCRKDGFLPDGLCQTKAEWAPVNTHFDKVTQHFRIVHLDPSQRWQVHGLCEPVSRMVHKTWFVLPPAQEYYYKRLHSLYRTLPPMRRDCERLVAADDGKSPISFLYPEEGTRIYIPIDLSEKKGRVVFQAVHRDPDARLFWHLDNHYIGETRTFHQQALDIAPGKHHITVVDGQGNIASRSFEVLDKKQEVPPSTGTGE